MPGLSFLGVGRHNELLAREAGKRPRRRCLSISERAVVFRRVHQNQQLGKLFGNAFWQHFDLPSKIGWPSSLKVTLAPFKAITISKQRRGSYVFRGPGVGHGGRGRASHF